MGEVKTETPFLEQLLDEVTPSVDIPEGLGGIAENINMEEVINALQQANANNIVYDNGYIFTYDKDSSCGQRSFWRCERKNECPARVHTNPLTNQIIKRIHQHSHEPPNPDELPPWLQFKNEERSTPPPGDYAHTSSPPGTCVLLPCPMLPGASVMQNLSHLIDQTEEKGIVNEREEEIFELPRKKSRKMRNREATTDIASLKEVFLQHPTEFWELFEATRKIVEFLKPDEGPSSTSCVTSTDAECNSAVASFLDSIDMKKYKTLFAKFSMEVMQSLSIEELSRLCKNEADALCIYHSLKIRRSSTSSPAVKVFVRELSVESDDEPIFQMLPMKNRTKEEFVAFLEKKGIIDTSTVDRFCISGPGGINVELSDDIVASWKNESVFQISVSKGVCKLESAVLRRYGKNNGHSTIMAKTRGQS
ncbi:FLYWCH zinc finger domain protein [Dictyocaulus viviparus]|uniref:FLYWCH zinc finger domain protein n=1 Tax=Dictyocaulus viviparus TaxID=29172 RepID=A0A0D8XZM6_DICVI|nr:FLYWCH zinc finger domain protein [Dictyocaulus viviparus]